MIPSSALSGVATGFASLRLVLKSFFCIEFLLTGREHKFLTAIFAYQCLVLIHVFYLVSSWFNNFFAPDGFKPTPLSPTLYLSYLGMYITISETLFFVINLSSFPPFKFTNKKYPQNTGTTNTKQKCACYNQYITFPAHRLFAQRYLIPISIIPRLFFLSIYF